MSGDGDERQPDRRKSSRARRRLDPTPETLALFPLTGAVLMPRGQLPLNIFEPRYLSMIDDALSGSRLIGMIQPTDEDDGPKPSLYEVGCAGRITSFAETDDGRYVISLTGTRRFRVIEELAADMPYRLARPDWSAFDDDIEAIDEEADSDFDREELMSALRRYIDHQDLDIDWDKAAAAPLEALVVSLAMGCPFPPNEKQALLEADTLEAQAACLAALMTLTTAGELDGDDDQLLQ